MTCRIQNFYRHLGQFNEAGTYATGVQYHPHGGIKQFTYGNGIVHTMALNARMLPVSSIDSGGVLHQLHTYDENGNVVATHDLNDTTRSRTMDYDGLDRLVEAQSALFGGSGVHRFEYDAVDNLMHWTLGGVKDYARYVYGADNRLARIEGTGGGTLHTFNHDVQGNVTDKDSTDYHFDIGNRLRAVVAPTVTETYRYDGHGRRVLAWTSAGSKLSMYSATGQIIYQQLFSATQNKAIDYITLSGSLVANREIPLGGGTAVVKYQHTDALGSPVAVTDSAGAVVERTNYDPYGGVIGGPKDGVGYTGHVMDAGTGLHYMQQRYYDPALGMFQSADPIGAGSAQGSNFNRYAYASNDPFGHIDPDGRMQTRRHKSFLEMVGAPNVDIGTERRSEAKSKNAKDEKESSGEASRDSAEKADSISLLAAAWASPNTAAGLFFGVHAYAAGVISGTDPSVSMSDYGSIQFENSPGWIMPTAISLGFVVVYGEGYAPGQIQRASGMPLSFEEHQHTRQSMILGPLYLPAHIGAGTAALVIDRDWHGATNFLEKGPHSVNPEP